MKFYQHINESVNNFDGLLRQVVETFYKDVFIYIHKEMNQYKTQKENDYAKRLENELSPYKDKIIDDIIKDIIKTPDYLECLLHHTYRDEDVEDEIFNILSNIYDRYLKFTNFVSFQHVEKLDEFIGSNLAITSLEFTLKNVFSYVLINKTLINKIQKDFVDKDPENIHNILHPTKETLKHVMENRPWILTDQIFSKCLENCEDLKKQWEESRVGKARKQIGL